MFWLIPFEGIPPSTNNLRKMVRAKRGRGMRYARTEVYENWLRVNIPRIEKLIPGPFPFKTVGILVVVEGGEGWHHSRDIDNIIKPSQDCLAKAGAILEDNHRTVRFSSSVFLPGKSKQSPAECFAVLVPWNDEDPQGSLNGFFAFQRGGAG